jgi:uncharacterized membrane protein (GlpM family)
MRLEGSIDFHLASSIASEVLGKRYAVAVKLARSPALEPAACSGKRLWYPPGMDLLWRFLLGGAMVSLFALIGDVLRPKRLAGIFGGAPSVALATLALTAAKSGPAVASLEARSMILSSLGFVLYVYVAERLLATARWSPLVVSLGGLTIWGLVAATAGVLLMRFAGT